MISKRYTEVLQDLNQICGCTRAAKNAEVAIRELITQRDDLMQALNAIVKTLSDADEEGLIEHAQQMVNARAAIAKAGAAA